jgi:hypothetical protein
MSLVVICINAFGFINNAVNSSNYIGNKKDIKNKIQTLFPNTGMVRLLANKEMGRQWEGSGLTCCTNTFPKGLRKTERKLSADIQDVP